MQRRRVMLARVESGGVKLPYLYDRGMFAEEFGGYTIHALPQSRLPDEYYVTPTIYGHFTRNTAPLHNDTLCVTSNSPVDISSYSSITVDFNITMPASGRIALTDGNYDAVARFILDDLTSGHNVLTQALSSPSNSILKIIVQFWASKYNTEVSINSIMLNK